MLDFLDQQDQPLEYVHFSPDEELPAVRNRTSLYHPLQELNRISQSPAGQPGAARGEPLRDRDTVSRRRRPTAPRSIRGEVRVDVVYDNPGPRRIRELPANRGSSGLSAPPSARMSTSYRHLAELESSECLFARKFNASAGPTCSAPRISRIGVEHKCVDADVVEAVVAGARQGWGRPVHRDPRPG